MKRKLTVNLKQKKVNTHLKMNLLNKKKEKNKNNLKIKGKIKYLII